MVHLLLLVRGANGTLHGPYRSNEERSAAACALLGDESPEYDIIPLDVETDDWDLQVQVSTSRN